MRPRDPEKLRAFNAAMDAGNKVPQAAKVAGISRPTAYAYAKLRKPAESPVTAEAEPLREQPLQDSVGDFAPMEPKKFQMLMLGEQRYLKNYAQSLTRSAPDADDLLSRANIKMLENRHRFRPGTNFRAWSTVIARNLFISDKRTIASKATVSIDHANGDGDEAGGPNPDSLPQFQVAPAQENGIVVREMKAAVMALPQDQRSALIESEVNGKHYDQIAEEAGVEVGTIKSRVHRARESLDKALPEVGAMRPQVTKLPPVTEPTDPYDFVLARLYADREAIDVAIAAIKKARRMANT